MKLEKNNSRIWYQGIYRFIFLISFPNLSIFGKAQNLKVIRKDLAIVER